MQHKGNEAKDRVQDKNRFNALKESESEEEWEDKRGNVQLQDQRNEKINHHQDVMCKGNAEQHSVNYITMVVLD